MVEVEAEEDASSCRVVVVDVAVVLVDEIVEPSWVVAYLVLLVASSSSID